MTIVYILAALIVGWVIGFLDSNLRTSKKIEAAEAKADLAISEAEQKVAEARAKFDAPKQAGPSAAAGDPGLLRLRNVEGIHQLEVNGESLDVMAVSADQRKRLIELLTIIRPWLEAGSPSAPAPKPAEEVRAGSTPAFVQRSAAAALTAASAAAAVEPRDLQSMSIVAQIDAILQKYLVGTPLMEKAIRLVEGSLGGVEVYVGPEKFSSVDEVPDVKIRAAIRAAVSEWETKLTPRE
ncbi:MAG: hypothetical protein FJZ87_16030 [Chloroflexi bacterium]|nr:hypothetical protein [Chloroflexota bacterium]